MDSLKQAKDSLVQYYAERFVKGYVDQQLQHESLNRVVVIFDLMSIEEANYIVSAFPYSLNDFAVLASRGGIPQRRVDILKREYRKLIGLI